MSVKFLLLGGGGECRFYFYGRADFSEYFRIIWEVLNGVGVDGVGGIFPFFRFFSFFFAFSFFFVFLRFSSFFFAFSSFFFGFSPILLGQGQTTAIYWENGEFHSTPSAPTPFGTSRIMFCKLYFSIL